MRKPGGGVALKKLIHVNPCKSVSYLLLKGLMNPSNVLFKMGIFLTCGLALLAACGEKSAEKPHQPVTVESPAQAPKVKPVTLKGDDVVLARVNGEPITQYDLEESIRSTLGEFAGSRLDEGGRRRVLESLVASRAMAQIQESELSERDKAELEKKVRVYREQLLVKQYLARHAPPEPVTAERIREFYESHPEQFGGRTVRAYEMIVSGRELKREERDGLIAVLGDAPEKKDWKKWCEVLKGQGYPVEFRRGEIAQTVLHPKLRQLMAAIKKGETSRVSFIEGRSYVVRIVEEKKTAPRPLGQVSGEIRKTLQTVELKESVREASREALERAQVVYEGREQARK